jgi:TonB family protein
MRSALSFVFLFFLTETFAFGSAILTYHHENQSFTVDGFDFTRPFHLVNGEKVYLPIEGNWGLDITNESFWDDCYFPKTYKVGQVISSYSQKERVSLFGIGFEEDNFPVGENRSSKLASFWLPDDFKNSLVVLGWFYDGKVTSVEVVKADKPVDGWLLNDAFRGFRITEEQKSGFPFMCIFDQVSLKLRPSINYSQSDSSDYLYRLACRGSAQVLKATQLSASDLRQVQVGEELTLMHGASLYGNMDVLLYLKEIGAHKVKVRGTNSLIRYAILGGRLDSVKFLAELGYSAIEKSTLLYPPFIEGIRLGHLDIADFLTDDNKYLKYSGKSGNALYQSLVIGNEEIFTLLKSKLGTDKPKFDSGDEQLNEDLLQKLLYENCSRGNVELVDALLKLGANPEAKFLGLLPLIAAVQSGNPELVSLLISNGADIKTKFGSDDSTYLHLASQLGFPRMIRLLVESGLDVDSLDSEGRTPLYLAVLSKKVGSVHELLDLKADPNLRPEKRPAPVWMAVVQDERESIQSLIQYGATCEMDSTLAMQLMDYALAFDIPEVVSISLQQCLTSDFTFRGPVPGVWVADYYDANLSKKVLVEAGADPEKQPPWSFETSVETIGRLIKMENFFVQYPKRLREKYGDLKVKVEVVIDPVGNVRFPKFLEPLPWDLRLFLRESIRKWSVELPQKDSLATAYRVIIPLELKSVDYGVKVFEIADVDKAPVPKIRFAPQYPKELKRDRVTGSVTVVFIVNEDGKVANVGIESTTNHGFNESALAAVRRWEFVPGYVGGEPVKTRVRLPLSFTLRN